MSDELSPPEPGAGDDASERATIHVGSALGDSLTAIGGVHLSLTLGVVQSSDGRPVLLPMVECGFVDAEDDRTSLWAGRLTLDNVAHAVNQAAKQLSDLMDPLAELVSGSLDVSAGRLAYSAAHMSSAGDSLLEAAGKLRALSERGSL